MPEDVLNCPLCGSDRGQFFDRREFRGQVVTNRLCQECGLVYQSPRMTDAESATFYAEEYRLLYEGTADPTARNVTVQRARAESLYTFARPVVEKVTRHLDIGCSLGSLLQRFAETYHCQPVGIEPGGVHRAHARKEGLTVYASLEELAKVGEGRFDLISMSHVLEHLPDPVGYLTYLRESLLDPAGWLLLEVPNLYAHDSFEVAHLLAFSPHTLRETLCKSGFDIAKFERHGRPNSELIPLYLTVLCRCAPQMRLSPVCPEQWVGFKRRLGMLRRRVLEKIFPKRAWIQ